MPFIEDVHLGLEGVNTKMASCRYIHDTLGALESRLGKLHAIRARPVWSAV